MHIKYTVSNGVTISTVIILNISCDLNIWTFYDISEIYGETDPPLQSVDPNQLCNQFLHKKFKLQYNTIRYTMFTNTNKQFFLRNSFHAKGVIAPTSLQVQNCLKI